jgi:hypothetical protein
MSRTPLSPEREAQAQQLLQALRPAVEEELLAIARTLAATDEATLFGQTEFDIRQLVHQIGAKAYQAHLARKKTATAGRRSPAPAAAKPPSSRPTARARP